MSLVKTGRGLYEALIVWSRPVCVSIVLLLMRIVYGWAFFMTGKGKLSNIPKFSAYFHELNIPFPTLNAWLVGFVECFGGLLLLAGLCSRPVALVLVINMTVAYITADWKAVAALFRDGDVPTFAAAAPFWFLVTSFVVLALGPGWFSIDALLKRFVFGRDETQLRGFPGGR